jgi:hypothetical protein
VDFERSGGLSKKTVFLKTHCIKKGFVSIGCAPCTRAIEGEDIRAGRWWWESSHKECTKGKENTTNNKENNNSREVLVEVTTLHFKL